MRSHDNSDDMSNMVGTVLSGFEYRANQEKLDNLTCSLEKMKTIIHILALLNKQSQNSSRRF